MSKTKQKIMYKIVRIPRKHFGVYELFIERKFLFITTKKSLGLFNSEHDAKLFILKTQEKTMNKQLVQCEKCQLTQAAETINIIHDCSRCKTSIKIDQTGMKKLKYILIPIFNLIVIGLGSLGLFIILILSVFEMTLFFKAGKISNLLTELAKGFTVELQETKFLKQYYLIKWDKL